MLLRDRRAPSRTQFIFGLVGATASVLIAYILPAAIFLSASSRPALLGQKDPDAARAHQGAHQLLLSVCDYTASYLISCGECEIIAMAGSPSDASTVCHLSNADRQAESSAFVTCKRRSVPRQMTKPHLYPTGCACHDRLPRLLADTPPCDHRRRDRSSHVSVYQRYHMAGMKLNCVITARQCSPAPICTSAFVTERARSVRFVCAISRHAKMVRRVPGSPSHHQWSSMRQKAAALALFGLVVGCLCTRATLLAVREEGEVVSLAVELAAKEQKARKWQPSLLCPLLPRHDARICCEVFTTS